MLENINKKYLVIAFIAFCVVMLSALFLLLSDKEPQSLDEVFDDDFQPKASTIVLNTVNGPINVNNIFTEAVETSDELQSSYLISPGIEYSAGGGGDQFVLTAVNDTGDIVEKENYLLSRLGVRKDLACVIPVVEFITNKDNEIIYRDNKFTFCN